MNNAIFYFFYNLAHQSQSLDRAIVFFAVYFPYLVTLALLSWLFYHKKWREVAVVFSSGIVAFGCAYILKILIHTPRPFLVLPNVHALFLESGYAFPSGHATFFSAIALSFFFHDKKIGYIFMFFAFLIGIARIIAGVHFPADILGGFVLGALVAYFVKTYIMSI